MASPFDALDAAVSAAIGGVFGEAGQVDLVPRLASQYAERAADPGRAPATISGVFSAGPEVTPVRGNATGEFAGTTRLASTAAEFWVSAAECARLGYAIERGDLVVLRDRPPCALTYAVAQVQRSDLGDANLILVREDGAED